MKKRIGLLICLVLVMTCAMALADVKIDAETFPDAHFRDYLAEFDTDRNGSLSENEINAVKKIEVPGYAINNLKGIEVFT